MVKSPPVAAFIMTQPEFLFEFLIVPLNHPAVLADPDQPFQREFHWQMRQPVTAWLPCTGGPLDQQPLLWLCAFAVGRGSDPQCGKSRTQRFFTAFAPSDLVPSFLRQLPRQLRHRDRLVRLVPSHPFGPRPLP